MEDVEEFCEDYEKITGGGGEVHFGIWGAQIWASNVVSAIDDGESFLDFLKSVGGYPMPTVEHDPLVIIPDFLELDLAFEMQFAFAWKYESISLISSDDDTSSSSSGSMLDCPIDFTLVSVLLPNLMSSQDLEKIEKCCGVYISTQKDCSKTFKDAHDAGNKCLDESGVKSNFTGKIIKMISVLTGQNIYTFEENYEPPSLIDIVDFVIFFVDEGWEDIQDGMAELWDAVVELSDGESPMDSISAAYDDLKDLIPYVQTLGKAVSEGVYISRKLENCKIASSWPIEIDFDIVFDLGFTDALSFFLLNYI